RPSTKSSSASNDCRFPPLWAPGRRAAPRARGRGPMERYAFILRRPLQLVPVLLGISFVTFVLAQLTPGDPIRVMLGPRATESAIAAVRARYGLDQPILVQYGYYMLNLLRADFGQSLEFRSSVLAVILERLWPTVFLLLYGLALSVLLTLTLAIA